MTDSLSKRPSISTLLLLSFVSAATLMLLGGAVALWQLSLMRIRSQNLYGADEPAIAVLRVRSDFVSIQQELQRLSESRDAVRFATESDRLRNQFEVDVERARQAVRGLPAATQRDAELASLDSVRTMFSAQLDSLVALGRTGDWTAVQLRSRSRIPLADVLSDGLVRDIDGLVGIEKKEVLESIRRAQVQASWTLVGTDLLAIIIVGSLGLLVTMNIAGRLQQLDAGARALARGEFQHQVVVAGNDEIARLARVFNEMASHLFSLYETLQESEAHFRSLIENARDFILIVADDGTLQYVSPSAERMMGSKSLLLGKHLVDFIDPEDAPAWRDFCARVRQTATAHTSVEFRVRYGDGSLRRWEALGNNLLQEPAVSGIVLNARDITDRRRMEEDLRASEERYRVLYEDTPSMYFTVNPEGTVLSVNQFGAAQLGYSPSELVGRSLLDLCCAEDKAVAQAHLNDCVTNPVRIFEWELRKTRKDGTVRWSREIARAAQNTDGRPVVRVVCEDITEVKRLEEQLRQSQKMEAIGTLSGGIAHDFNNLLTIIKGYSRLVLEGVQVEKLRRHAECIDEAADRAAALTSQLLAFSRRQVLQPKNINLNALVTNLSKMLQRLIGEDVEMVTRNAPDLGAVKADPSQIEQVIMNLVVNARDAMPKGGKLCIETGNVDLDEAEVRDRVGMLPGRYVVLTISDTGMGMSQETLAHVFEPFFTTKEMGRGTGLGLSMVYGIVKQSGGYIWVYSELEHGTTFKVYLPRVEEPAETLPLRRHAEASTKGTETILLVEDNEQLRELAQIALATNGYQVLAAERAESVTSVCEQHPGPIHLLITDVVMPGIGGYELAALVVARRPGLKVLYMSGYSNDAIVNHGVLAAGTFFLQKPFTLAALATKVREVLDSNR